MKSLSAKLAHDWRYLALFLSIVAVEIGIARYLHDRLIRPYGGDALAVVLVYALIRSFYPGSVLRCTGVSLLIAFMVEVTQYFQLVARLGLSDNPLARTVLGSSFDWGDMVAYSMGAAAILLAERLARHDPTG